MTKQPNSPQSGQNRQAGQPGQAGGQTGAMRQQQQYDAGEGGHFAQQIRPQMEVIGADGGKVGKVERVDGNRLRIAAEGWQGRDSGSAHYLPLAQVGSIEGDRVRLTTSAQSATSQAAIA